MSSLSVLQFLSEKENFIRFGKYVKPHTLSDHAAQILKDMDEWYKSHEDIDWNDFAEWFKVAKHSTMKPEKMALYDVIFTNLDEAETEPDKDIIEHYIAQDYCTEISEIALKGAEGESVDVTDIEDLVKQWHDSMDSATSLEKFVVNDSLDDILDSINLSGLQWRSDFLNRAVGNLRKGKLICFAARPNVGKTTFLATEGTYFAPQLKDDECVLWINNEEDGGEVKYRTVQAALQRTNADIDSNRIKAANDYTTAINGKNKLVIVDKADASVKDVEEYIRQYKPGVIIFDQLWKVHGFEKTSSNDTARLQRIFSWAREIAKMHAPVITVHQLKTEAEGVKWLTPNQLYLSGTAIQGEVDTLILMGRTYDPSVPETERYITIGKNKGAYGPMVDTSLREGKTTWHIVPDKAMFVEV